MTKNQYSPSSLSTYDPVDKVRILIVGDSSVGKTSLLHLLCQNEPLKNSDWSIGFNIDVKVRSFNIHFLHFYFNFYFKDS
jgi:GTPase SAR1 family protein